MQKDLYAPYPYNLNRLLSVTHARRASVVGRREASGATGRRQARAEGERAGARERRGRAQRAGARRARRPSAAVVSTHLSRMNLRFLDPFS